MSDPALSIVVPLAPVASEGPVPRENVPAPRERQELVVELARALHTAGAAAHILEDAAMAAARAVGLPDVSLHSTPTAIHVSFGPAATYVLRVSPRDVDLSRLVELERLITALVDAALVDAAAVDAAAVDAAVVEGEVVEGTLAFTLASARERLAAIMTAPAPYRKTWLRAAQAVVSGAVAAAFGGGLVEVSAAAAVGISAGVMADLLDKTEAARRAVYLFASFGAGMVAAMLDATGGVSGSIVILGGLITLFPGYTLTTAVAELATTNLVAGTSRMMAAVLVLLQLAVGTALADKVGTALFGVHQPVTIAGPPLGLEILAVLVAGAGLSLLVQVPARALWASVLACLVSFGGARVGASLVGPEIGVGLGALLVTAGANLYAVVFKRPSLEPLVPAIVLLVPGSVGYRSMMALVEKQTVTGVEIGVSMLLIAMSIVAGMTVANALVSPRLRT